MTCPAATVVYYNITAVLHPNLDTCASGLNAGASCISTVACAPSTTGIVNGTFSVTDNAVGSPHTAALSCTGTAPVATMAPATFNFGNQPVGTQSAQHAFTLSNTGAGVLANTIFLTGSNPGDFVLANSCTDPLLANSTCTANVSFRPTTAGTRTATLSSVDSATGSPHTSALTGFGSALTVTLLPTTLTFSGQTLGTTSAAQDVALKNTGNITLNIVSTSTTGDFSRTTTCGATLAAGATCTISVSFTPTAVGSRSGALSVEDDANGSPQTVPLTGTGTAVPFPIATITPSSLAFGNQVISTTSASQPITLQNTGTATLNIASILATGNFAVSSTTCGATLAATVSCQVNVTFTPTAIGARTGAINFTDDATGSPQSVSLTGTGVSAPAPIATVSPTLLTFSGQVILTTSAPQNVTLKNDGNATLNISSIGMTGDFSKTTTCGATLAAGVSCTVSVFFTPTATGNRAGFLTFSDNANGSPQSVALMGTGLSAPAPIATISPSSLTFASTTVGVTSAAQTVTLQNTGTATLNIASILTTGDYSRTTTCGATLAATLSCTVDVKFTPTATGSRTGTLSFTDNATGSPQTVTLTGTGVAPTAPVVSFSPSSLLFPSTTTGVTSASQAVLLTNTGNAALNITSLTPSGDFAILSTGCGATLGAGVGCTINVNFTPTATGSRNGLVTMVDNAAGSPHTVPLSGTGTAPLIPVASISPTSLTFPNQIVTTTSAAQTILLTNDGNGPLSITSIVASGDFSRTTTCGATLAATTTCSVSVTFTPTATGTRNGTIAFTDNASGSPQTVTLTGNGVPAPQPAVTLSPTSLTFPSQTVGTTSTAQVVQLTNSGTATLNLTSVTITGNFAISANNCGLTLGATLSCNISVTFTPTASGNRTGTLSFTNDAPGSPQTVSLQGSGLALTFPAASITPTSLDFGNQVVLTGSTTKLVTLTNTGSAALNIASITASSEYSVDSTTCGASLAINVGCQVNVKFTPSAIGTRPGTLSFTDNAAGSPQTVSLTGAGVPAPQPIAVVSPTSLTFPSTFVGQTSGSQDVTLTNAGDATLNISSLSTNNDFFETTTCGLTLAAQASCVVHVVFHPNAPGTRTGVLSFTDDANGSPQTVSLSGVGIQTTPAVCLNPASINFNNQPVGSTSASVTETITNCGTANLIVSSTSTTGDFARSTTCGTVAPNATCTAGVTFTPTVTGSRSGTLVINSNASTSPDTLALSGFGTQAGATLLPAYKQLRQRDCGDIVHQCIFHPK